MSPLGPRFALLDTNGNIAIIAALSAAVLLGGAGMATIYVETLSAKASVQASLDSAVLAATAMPPGSPPQKRIAMAKRIFEFNLTKSRKDTGAVFSLDDNAKFLVNQTVVTGAATGKVHNTLGDAIGITEFPFNVDAAATKMVSDPLCILALNQKSKSTVEAYGNAHINAIDCPIQANSDNGRGMNLTGAKSSVTASMIGVTGGYSGTNWSPLPTTGTEPITDPYAGIPLPDPDDCTTPDFRNRPIVLEPGTYCGGLKFASHDEAELKPGVYIIKDGQFSVGSGANVSGKEVMIALVGKDSYFYLNSGSSLKLTSPTRGIYKNMQAMSDRDLSGSKFNEEWTTILSGATFEYDGTLYLPEQQFWASGTGHDIVIKGNSPSLALVADKVWAQGNVVIEITQENHRGLTDLAEAPGIAWGARLAD